MIKQDGIRFLKFSVVGGSGVLVNMVCLWFFTDVVGLFYLVSSVIAISIAMINNFIWNDLWTWKDRGEAGHRAYIIRLVKFILISSLAGYGGNLGIFWLLTHHLNFNYLIANLIGIGIGTIINFLLNHLWTFKK